MEENCYLTDQPPVRYIPGHRTLRNFLAAALAPVGTTLYVYGGGWNRQDTGASAQAVTIGQPAPWRAFFLRQDERYDYRNYRSAPETVCNPFGWAGADCSGYLGWVVYNTMHSRSGGAGYVRPAVELARALAERHCYGIWTQRYAPEELRPGDVVSIPGHVWICLGQCSDGSAVILHSTPSPSVTGRPGGGVQLSGMGERENCLAVQLARWYMGQYYPEWSRRYRAVCKSLAAYTKTAGDCSGRFRWSPAVLSDPDGCAGSGAEALLRGLFDTENPEKKKTEIKRFQSFSWSEC